MRSAATQVEMDEFMTLRRLNLKIQGFPESYATEPHLDEDMVVGEPMPPRMREPIRQSPPLAMTHPQDPMSMLGSPIRSSPISEDPITA